MKAKRGKERRSVVVAAVMIQGLVLSAGMGRADVVVMADGTKLEGKAHREGDQWIVTDATGKETSVAADEVVSIQIGGDASPAEQLLTLRSGAEHLSDPRQIIERYEKFIKANSDNSAGQQAQDDLKVWRQRVTDGCVKVGSRWMTASERAELTAGEATAAANIVDLIQSGQIPDAQKAIGQALGSDPDDPAALYLHGLLLAQANQNVPARAELEHADKIAANHGPTLNNLAVVLGRQNLGPASLKIYGQAMTASPVNKTILDNVAEALNDLPPPSRSAAPVQEAARIFATQDAALQQTQKAQGLSRWGAKWVPTADIGKLQAEDLAMQSQLDEIQADFDKTQASIADDDVQIQQQQQALTNASYMSPLPLNYTQMQQDLNLLTSARQVGANHLEQLKARAARVQRSLSVPKFGMAPQLIGPEGAPIRVSRP